MSGRRNSQVGFRDDTTYLAAHYGGRVRGRTGSHASHNDIPTPRDKKTAPWTSTTPRPTDDPAKTPQQGGGNTARTSRAKVGKGEDGRRHIHGTSKTGGGATRAAGGASIRPTLSEQLGSIGKAAEDITAGIREAYGLRPLQGALLTTPSQSFLVGRLRCKYPSPVHFFNHKCVYTFHHPFEATRITMEMFFRDMRCAALDAARRQLRFKIDHPLCHYQKDYAHDDPSHFVVIELSSDLDAQRVAEEIMPLIQRSGGVH